MNRRVGLGLLLVLLGALALRAPQLANRPMHNDEAVNAHLIRGLWENGLYKYNPEEYHGPTLYYVSLPSIWLSGAKDFSEVSEGTFRLVPVFFGVVLILLFGLLAEGMSSAALISAAILAAVSPAMVFYSRYYIHEMLLVCFSMLALGAGWRYVETRQVVWAILAGVGVGLMYATKETFVIALGAMVLAGVATKFWSRWSSTKDLPAPFYWRVQHYLLAAAAGAIVGILLFTSFFTNMGGLADSVRTYFIWAERAGGRSPHVHEAMYYLTRLAWFHAAKGPIWSEAAILGLALVGGVVTVWGKGLGGTNRALARFLLLYTVIMTAAYSAISYKTPWCMLGFLHGMILLAGIGAAALLSLFRPWPAKALVGLVLAGLMAHLGWEAWRASFVLQADRKKPNPYIYSQTWPDILKLVERVQGIAKVPPVKEQELIKVIAPNGNFWPLPWYFRNFSRQQIGYYGDSAEIDKPFPIMIVAANYGAALDEKTNKKWLSVGYYELRTKVFFELYVEFELWKKYIEGLPRSKEEEPE